MARLRVLGGFALEDPSGAQLLPLPQRRAKAVLAVLAVCGDLGCTRERLVALLWPESDEAHSRHGLSDTLGAIRRALGPDAVVSVGDLLRLDPAVVSPDVVAFAQAVRAGRPADGVREYGGPLLEGFHLDHAPDFERWLDAERSRLAREYGEALADLATAAERAAVWGEAAGWWAQAVEHDPLNSSLALRHAEALAAIGDRANALKAADEHVRRLRDELELEPDPELLAGIERIRRREAPPARGGGRSVSRAAPAQATGAIGEPSTTPAAAVQAADGATVIAASATATRRRLRWLPPAAGLAVIALAAAFGIRHWLRPGAAEARPPHTAIAILPFENFSADSQHAYFAGALHDELLTQLAKVRALRVIGRTSVLSYAGTTKRLRQIGAELAVGSIVEGSLQVSGNRLRVNVQLIDPVTEAHLWAERYDATLDDAFAVQSDIARQIVASVGATLTSAEAGALAAAPTWSADAYRLYLQGMDYWRRPREGEGPCQTRRNVDAARQLFQRAVDLDSTFALAHAALAVVDANLCESFSPSPSQLALQRREAETAFRLAPDLPQSHFALATMHHSRGDQTRALEELRVAARGAPNDAEVWEWIGLTSRHLGSWDSALAAFDHASRLDPRDTRPILDRAQTLDFIKRYPEAISAYRQALVLAPDLEWARIQIAWSYVKWRGDWDTLQALVRRAPLEAQPGLHLVLLSYDRRPDSILALLDGGRLEAVGWLDRTRYSAVAHLLLGDTAAAWRGLDSVVAHLDSAERARPDDPGVHIARANALAWRGRRAEALRELRWIERSDMYRKDRQRGPGAASGLAWTLVRLGETDAALVELERLLAGPGPVTVHTLSRDPFMDPIREDPRFQALLMKYADPAIR